MLGTAETLFSSAEELEDELLEELDEEEEELLEPEDELLEEEDSLLLEVWEEDEDDAEEEELFGLKVIVQELKANSKSPESHSFFFVSMRNPFPLSKQFYRLAYFKATLLRREA